MPDTRYKIIFTGKTKDDVTRDQAIASLKTTFKLDDERAERYFSGKPMVLKKDMARQQVEKFSAIFEKIGLEIEIEPPLKPEKPALTLEPKADPPDSGEVNPYQPPTSMENESRAVSQKQVYCRQCGTQIGDRDEHCPSCGEKQIIGYPRSKIKAALFAWGLGFFGVHRFYLGQWWGIVYFLFGFLAWPVAIVEGLVFLLTSEEKWQAKYGNVIGVGKTSKIVIFVILLPITIATIGILAAIALPAYNDYTIRAKVALGEPTVTENRLKVEETIRRLNYNFLPNSNLDAGLPETVTGPNIQSLQVIQNGVIEVTYSSEKQGALDGETILWVPVIENEKITWNCNEGTLPKRYRQPACREPAIHVKREAPAFSGENVANPNLVQRVSSEGLFEMDLPRDWKRMDELNEQATLAYAKLREELYVIVIPEDLREVSGIGIDDYTDIVLGHLMESMTNVEVIPLEEKDLKQLPARHFVVHGSSGDIQLSFRLAIAQSQSHYYQILAWSLESKFEKNYSTLNQVVESFREKS